MLAMFIKLVYNGNGLKRWGQFNFEPASLIQLNREGVWTCTSWSVSDGHGISLILLALPVEISGRDPSS